MYAATLILRRLSSIPTQPLHWLWKNRIPYGKITLLAGDPGSGKTSLLLDLAARLSRGHPMPPHPTFPSSPLVPQCLTASVPSPQSTLLLSPNDDPADTLRPKLEALHANLDLIHIPEDFHTLIPAPHKNPDASPLATPLEKLDAACTALPNLALIIIDPITHFLGLTDHLAPPTPDDPDSPRSILAQLAALAQKHHVALLLTTRLTKKIDPTLPAHSLQKILGPLAFPSTARSVILLTPFPQSPPSPTARSNGLSPTQSPPPILNSQFTYSEFPAPTHLLLPLKLSAAPLPNPIPFTLAEPILWHPEISIASLRPAPYKSPGPPDIAAQRAVTFLQTALAHGPVSAYTMAEDAKSNHISHGTLDRAKLLLNIQSTKQDWSGKWFWHLPNDTRPLPEDPHDRHFAELLLKPPPSQPHIAPGLPGETPRNGKQQQSRLCLKTATENIF